MAKRKSARSTRSSRRWPWALLFVLLAAGAAFAWYRTPITGYAQVSSAYAARVACSCRFVAGRTMEDCAKDKLGGMELVSLSEDEEEQSVTASFLLLASDTARLRDGYGCVLEPWEG
ncbi:hypothetical protein [Erythrobacter litoralis]|uniref:Uncharacterized protein n=1 Tax=Erythrobacter litoralis (strain HTCC2594) TaxID=314225 RepID=Q2N6A8_ERYLH|nr:hypothetical protein [Erythrobacter litoralis]ABC64783.1 hypothetical protein ELI_13455 [Erythrobacter litoralis HTCC2594]